MKGFEIPLGHVEGKGYVPYVHPGKVERLNEVIREAHDLLKHGRPNAARIILGRTIEGRD